MPRLTPQSYQILFRVFKKAGFTVKRTYGSHIITNQPGVDRPIVIPKYDEVDVDIIRANLRTARISREKYFEFLKRISIVKFDENYVASASSFSKEVIWSDQRIFKYGSTYARIK